MVEIKKPLLEIPEETRRNLPAMLESMKKAEAGIALLKEMGVDASELEGHLKWAKRAMEILITETKI